jgi:deoxyribodipyrimidine photolyase-related protein
MEDSLFFQDPKYPLSFHQQKLMLHRASMKAYAAEFMRRGYAATYVDWNKGQTVGDVLHCLAKEGMMEFHHCEVVDFILELRLKRFFEETSLKRVIYESPMFLTPDAWRNKYFSGRKRFLMGAFYQEQRKRMNVLIDRSGQPTGGRWSFDEDNRKRFPKGAVPPPEPVVKIKDKWVAEASDYVQQHWPENPGSIEGFAYPIDHEQARMCLQQFLQQRFAAFGDYEDAISMKHRIMHHSVLTPALNIGLLTPQEVIDATLAHAEKHQIPFNSLEGFIRQIIGWREFMRAVYVETGVKARTKNFWGFTRKMPRAFYEGTTGIPPVDDVIRRVKDHAYAHHIERLMVIGNFMLLCRIHPDEVYAWFMEMFIDAYDWVMVPNVYGMSQFADGGMFTTKPYLSGSNYILKMSDYPKGPWCEIWDALFWCFIADHEDFFLRNPRLSMMARQMSKMRGAPMDAKRQTMETFLAKLG